MKRLFRYFLYTSGVVLAVLLFIALVGIAPVNRNIDRTEATLTMREAIKNLQPAAQNISSFHVGFAKVNLTPPFPVATAGYGKRKGKIIEGIRDSVFVRAMVLHNGSQRVAIVSADLLIIPPTVTALLERELPQVGFSLENTYLGATHSHNSIGNWGEGATALLYGAYDDKVIRLIVDQIKESIASANRSVKQATLKSGTIAVPDAVRNRLIKNGPVDSLLRVVEMHQSDGSKQVLLSYTAHATCLSSRDLRLSRDYPGALVDAIEAQGYSFAMFMAGAVGSHACRIPEGEDCIGWMASELSSYLTNNSNALAPMSSSALAFYRVPLLLTDPQPKLTGSLRLRAWLFRYAFGEYPVHLNALRIGNVLMIGTPCDYSGEFNRHLDQYASQYGLTTMITSFNGGYIGYVTPDKYFDEDHYETRLMNWYGYGNGDYVTSCIESLIEHSGHTHF
ncbi:MAG: neutral/alkaline non-lysosomal ceramidase N-terminal domain-containing protein [Cyclobacteriaceae bacterium]|nr:neutral/alkaline non-lysosomal ceramidase N-terminal domain-containing protein [Cyclobacteriaceae bacterium]